MRAIACLLGLLLAVPGWADALFNEQGYRIANYRRATPDTAPAGQLITTAQLQRLIETESPLLIDVQAVSVRPESAEFGFAWLPSKARYHIPGSVWLPNVGYGELEPLMQDYLANNLERLTAGDKNRPLVIYCVLDCWMSWNTVRRTAALGYSNLYWYPEGSDGWEQAGLELAEGKPEPLQVRQFFSSEHDLDLALLLQQARESGRDLLLFHETEHCPFCTRMRRTVLRDADVITRLDQDFIAVAIDIEADRTMRDEHAESVSERDFARRGQRIVRTPTLVFYDADFAMLHRHSGLVATPTEMIRLLDFVAERAYQDGAWKSYRNKR
jgi:PQQ-dependent catabolism-associated CXXCW motif protein